jgi:hypothetical protein
MWRWAHGSASGVTHQLVMPQVAVWGSAYRCLEESTCEVEERRYWRKVFSPVPGTIRLIVCCGKFSRLVPLRTQRDERAGVSEALVVCDLCSESAAIRFLGSDYVTARSQSAASSFSRRGRELHCDHLPASTAVHDFEKCTMATSVNGASDALGMGPSAGYILFSSLCQFLVFMCYIVSVSFYMPWMFIYVILMLAGMFRLSCLYVFYYDLGSYMIYNLTVIFVLSYLGIYEHINHPFCIHVNIYDAML